MRSILFLCLAVLCIVACQDSAKQTTPSGYEYQMIKNSKGNSTLPVVGDKVSYHEDVYKNDSLLFSTRTTRIREAVIPKPEEIKAPAPPNLEALLLMSVEDSVVIYQPLDTFKNLPPNFTATDILSFRIKLTDIMSKEAVAAEKAALEAAGLVLKARESEVETACLATIKDYKAGSLNSKIKTTESGLKYLIHEEGTGAQAVAGNQVSVQYSGFLTDGKNFDNSFKRGQAFEFKLGQGMVIPGWDEGLALLKEGAKATLFIPANLGYGERGAPPNIPPNSELVFYVELEKAK